jgi:hypothetical protein
MMMRKSMINRNILKQTVFDSGALPTLCSVIHTLSAAGEYFGTLILNEQPAGNFTIVVEDKAPNNQATIDLAALQPGLPRHFSRAAGDRFRLRTNGNVVFYVSEGGGGYAVTLSRAGAERREAIFDSRALRDGDIFLVTLLRPGAYRLANTLANQEAKISVGYPEAGKTRLTHLVVEPVEVTERGFSRQQVEMRSAQGLALQCNAPSRLRLELVEPYERARTTEVKAGAARPNKVTWRKPGMKAPPVK